MNTTARRGPRRLAAAVALAGVLAGCAAPAPSVTDWIQQNGVVLGTVDPAAPLDDLAPLGAVVGDAQIVGLGESVHGAAEQITLKHRTLRLLVEQLGFRTVAWEEDWTTGLLVDDYLRTGSGDLGTIVGRLSPQWQSRQVADVLRWLRAFNTGRSDPVRFVGVEYYLTGPAAYDAVEAYVGASAPDRLAELRTQLRAIRPDTADMFGYVQRYLAAPDRTAGLPSARRVQQLVDGVPHADDDPAHALASHHARQIVSFHEHYAMPDADALVFRDAHAAENLRWWRERHGGRTAYWGAAAHTANAPRLSIAVPPDPELRFPSAGSYLRRWYGPQYLSIGFTVDHGNVSPGFGAAATLPATAPDWFERPLGEVPAEQFVLDLRRPAPPPVRGWLDAPLVTRGLPDRGPGSRITGGTPGAWFDVLVHRQQATPVAAP